MRSEARIGLLALALAARAVAHDPHDPHDAEGWPTHTHETGDLLGPEHTVAFIPVEPWTPVALATPAFLAREDPWQAGAFAKFGPQVRTRADGSWLFIESDGMPHALKSQVQMVGITAWQQQVPLPQPYTGANAWQVPLHPELAETPVDGRRFLRRGAIAVAVDGIPIFNALNNRGEDSYAIGELDQFGGHCGRADDYHYHAAPLALQQLVGMDKPIAFALDGFPIYGLFDPKAAAGSPQSCPLGGTEPLDQWNGHFCETSAANALLPGTRGYHYHASKSYPYINGGMRGKVRVEEDQIVPQPRTTPVRPSLTALRGAAITGFRQTGAAAWALTYTLAGKEHRVEYQREGDGSWKFSFVSPDGTTKTETYAPGRGGGRGERAPRDDRGQRGDRPPRDGAPRDGTPPAADRPARPAAGGFEVHCDALSPDGMLPARFTCDGEAASPPLAWSGLPAGTRSVAVTIHHVPPGDERTHAYLVLWGLPPETRAIAENQRDLGRWGTNTINGRAEYAPPCSKGPGVKSYIVTVHALSAEPTLEAGRATYEQLAAAIRSTTLATATLELRYARPGGADGGAEGAGAKGGGKGGKGERGTLLSRMTAFKTEVPAHDHDVVLVRPMRDSMTASVVAASDRLGQIEYWQPRDPRKRQTAELPMKAGVPANFVMEGLAPDAAYRYRLCWRTAAGAPQQQGEEDGFQMVRSPGKEFTFAIQADSHLDQGVDLAVYERTLRAIAKEDPDFLVDLGDTFMTDKRGQQWRSAQAQYDAQRYWFGIPCRGMPLFMVLGNHDGERGSDARARGGEGGGDAAQMPAWSYAMRTERFPAPPTGAGAGASAGSAAGARPAAGAMYTGRTGIEDGRGSNYYAFEWGDALFVVLDPFWPTTERIRGGSGGGSNRGGQGGNGGNGGNGGGGGPGERGAPKEPLKPVDGSWASTLGREQYDWLDRTLSASKARHKFVFIHHLVGGMGGAESRGGVESAPFFEWGGRNPDGSDGFAQHRPGWPMPIHELLVKRGVGAVFYGHDHLYVHGQRDGIHYQCVPQPGNPAGNTRSAAEYGYASGTIMGSPGHVRVRVAPTGAKVEFVRTGTDAGGADAVRDSYEIAPRAMK